MNRSSNGSRKRNKNSPNGKSRSKRPSHANHGRANNGDANNERRPLSRLRYPLHAKVSSLYPRISKRPDDSRDMMVVYFGNPLNVTIEYDGKRRDLMREHLPFYQTTASSTTNTDFPWLKDTWFPCFGLGKIGRKEHIFKLSGLKSRQGAVGKWPTFLDQTRRTKERLNQPFFTMDDIPFKDHEGKQMDEHAFLKVLGDRSLSWDLLRISAGVGDGFWEKVPRFREFVMSHGFYLQNREFIEYPYFLDAVRKSNVLNTSQVYEYPDNEVRPEMLACRISDIPELRIVGDDGFVDFIEAN